MYQKDVYNNSRKLYRSKNRVIFGVCRGFAEWKDLPVGWIRFFTLLAFVSTGFFPVGLLYLLAAFFIPLEPDESSHRDSSRDYSHYDRESDWDKRFSRKKREDE